MSAREPKGPDPCRPFSGFDELSELVLAWESWTLPHHDWDHRAHLAVAAWHFEHYDELDPIVASRMIQGKDVLAADYLQVTLDWKRLRREVLEQLRDVDAVLCPTTAIPACPLAEVQGDMDTYLGRIVLYLRNTAIGSDQRHC